jgi:hypothetical protein
MPGFDGKFRVVAIADGPPARGHGPTQIWLGQSAIDSFGSNSVDSGAERLIRAKVIGRVRRSGIDLDGLRA